MKAFVLKHRRKSGNSTQISQFYTGRNQLSWMRKPASIALKTKDKQVAERRLIDHILKLEREKAGLPVPVGLWGEKEKSLSDQLEAYEASLTAKERGKQHISDTAFRIRRLIEECDWNTVDDISAPAFEKWRATKAVSARNKKPLSAKSKNEYLLTWVSFINWMNAQGVMNANPLAHVEEVEKRGREVKRRRAWTDDELRTFLATKPFYWQAVFIAARTGLRRSEIQKLAWGDIHLEAENPFILLRSSTTKNKKPDPIPLVKELKVLLLEMRPKNWKQETPVLAYTIPKPSVIRKNIEAAGLTYKDGLGRDIDFHTLRLHLGDLPRPEWRPHTQASGPVPSQ